MNGIIAININALMVTQINNVNIITTCESLRNNVSGIILFNYDAFEINSDIKFHIS